MFVQLAEMGYTYVQAKEAMVRLEAAKKAHLDVPTVIDEIYNLAAGGIQDDRAERAAAAAAAAAAGLSPPPLGTTTPRTVSVPWITTRCDSQTWALSPPTWMK